MRCEDYPCCGHTDGDPCPDRDPVTGEIIPRCVECGSRLPVRARHSFCNSCLRAIERQDRMEREGYFYED